MQRMAVVMTFVLAFAATATTAGPPAPPIKPGLWQTKMTTLDASGKEVPSPGQDALARMPPEARARMAEMMKGRGMALPEPDGTMKLCVPKEMLDSGAWQQSSADTGCTMNYLSTSGSTWKWHSSCKALGAESDGEITFTNSENYQSKITTTTTLRGQVATTTRLMQSKWLGADCGDIKPITPGSFGPAGGRGR